MILQESQEYAYVVGIVGEAGSGKSTLAVALARHLSESGLQIVTRNAGDAFREEACRRGTDVATFIAQSAGNRRELDKTVDSYTLDHLRLAIGISEWRARFGERPPVVLILASRMLSWLAEIPLHSGDLPPDGVFRIAVACNDEVKGVRGKAEALLRGEELSEEEALRRYKERDADDEASFGSIYGIESMDMLWDREIHDMVLRSDRMTVEQEVDEVVCELKSRRLLWGECLANLSGDLLHV